MLKRYHVPTLLLLQFKHCIFEILFTWFTESCIYLISSLSLFLPSTLPIYPLPLSQSWHLLQLLQLFLFYTHTHPTESGFGCSHDMYLMLTSKVWIAYERIYPESIHSSYLLPSLTLVNPYWHVNWCCHYITWVLLIVEISWVQLSSNAQKTLSSTR